MQFQIYIQMNETNTNIHSPQKKEGARIGNKTNKQKIKKTKANDN